MKWRLTLSFLIALMGWGKVCAEEQATIEQAGSTNTGPVKMTVSPAGKARVYSHNSAGRTANVDAVLSQRLFDDLKAAGPLSALPPVHCMKSASFGTSLFLTYNGETSPDLSCPAAANSQLGPLQRDVRDLMQAAHATPHSRRALNYLTQIRIGNNT